MIDPAIEAIEAVRDDILRLAARLTALEAAAALQRGTLANPTAAQEADGPVSLTHEAPTAPPHKE